MTVAKARLDMSMPRETLAKTEITLKISSVPDVVNLPHNLVGFGVSDESGIHFWVECKAKTWRNVEAKIRDLPSWVIRVQGKLSRLKKNTIWLREAGLSVIEKSASKKESLGNESSA